MGQPNKKRGFRKITVDGQNFNWRLAGVIDVRPDSQKENKLTIDFGWYDEWLYVNDKENRPPDFEPQTVTPSFVRQAILYALDHKWGIKKKTGLMQLKYNDGRFEVNARQQRL
jgi:hypothetical protein